MDEKKCPQVVFTSAASQATTRDPFGVGDLAPPEEGLDRGGGHEPECIKRVQDGERVLDAKVNSMVLRVQYGHIQARQFIAWEKLDVLLKIDGAAEDLIKIEKWPAPPESVASSFVGRRAARPPEKWAPVRCCSINL